MPSDSSSALACLASCCSSASILFARILRSSASACSLKASASSLRSDSSSSNASCASPSPSCTAVTHAVLNAVLLLSHTVSIALSSAAVASYDCSVTSILYMHDDEVKRRKCMQAQFQKSVLSALCGACRSLMHGAHKPNYKKDNKSMPIVSLSCRSSDCKACTMILHAICALALLRALRVLTALYTARCVHCTILPISLSLSSTAAAASGLYTRRVDCLTNYKKGSDKRASIPLSFHLSSH
jgi:hypothetical protein